MFVISRKFLDTWADSKMDSIKIKDKYGKELTHCILNRLSHTTYWKSPISILGTSDYEIYIFLEKNG